jgi:hypothetical protein
MRLRRKGIRIIKCRGFQKGHRVTIIECAENLNLAFRATVNNLRSAASRGGIEWYQLAAIQMKM